MLTIDEWNLEVGKIPYLESWKKEPCSYTKHLSMGLQLLSWIIAGGAPNSQEPVDKTYYVMLPPELCLVHPLPGPLVRGAQRLPSVMRRVESMLLAVQLKHQINFPIAATKVNSLACLLLIFENTSIVSFGFCCVSFDAFISLPRSYALFCRSLRL